MALSQSALSELLDAFRAGDGADLIRDSVRVVLQELVELEAAEHVGADRYDATAQVSRERPVWDGQPLRSLGRLPKIAGPCCRSETLDLATSHTTIAGSRGRSSCGLVDTARSRTNWQLPSMGVFVTVCVLESVPNDMAARGTG
jgi:hypothetical protein